MDNSINNVTFTARLQNTNIKISNNRRLQNIGKKFAEETMKFSDEKYSLYMSEFRKTTDKQPVMTLHLSTIQEKTAGKKNNGIISHVGGDFITKPLDEYLATMTDTQIAKRFIKIFKVLHYKNLLSKKLPAIKADYERAVSEIDELKPKATDMTEKQLVKEIESTIKKLQKQYMRIRTTSLQNIRKLSRGDAELEKFTEGIL